MLNYKKEKIKEHEASFDQVIENVDFYIDSFLQDGILILKRIHCSELEQRRIQAEFGDKLGLYPNKSSMFSQYFTTCDDDGFRYFEDHENALKENHTYPNISSNEIIVDPHLECTHYKFPQVAAFWSMNTFSCKPKCGMTFFYDSRIIMSKLNEESIDFLRKSKVVTNPSGERSTNFLCGIHDAVAIHRNVKDEILRLDYKYSDHIFLHEYDNRAPEQEEIEFFYNDIMPALRGEIDLAMKDHNFWYQWSEGDLVIPDLSVMYHAVNGGFLLGERSFLGFWSFPGHKESLSQFSEGIVDNYVKAK